MDQMTSCIFCQIVAGQLESSKVYEDNEVLAFMDIQPVRRGQVLVIPKQHIDHFSDIPDALALRLYMKTHALLKAVRKVVRPERVGLVVHGYGVSHAHVVIVPQHHEDDITSGRMADIENDQVIFTIKKLPVVPREELDQMAQLIKKSAQAHDKQT
jgi:histidine triad (HIT) family protein